MRPDAAAVLIIGLDVLSWGGLAPCQEDPWSNAVGIYFDETATTNEVHVHPIARNGWQPIERKRQQPPRCPASISSR
jgi:hypothetical protein